MLPAAVVMNNSNVSRRQFAFVAGTAAAATIPLRAANVLKAREIVLHIQASLGTAQSSTTSDGIKAGDPDTPVKGIATTAMATLAVLKRASAAGANLVITYEPTFFRRQDAPATTQPARGPLGLAPEDPVYKAKREYIEKNGLAIYRLRDAWQSRREDDMVSALAESLGWSKGRVKPDDVLFDIPDATAEDTVARVRKKLNLRGGLRAVGDRKAIVRRVLLHPGPMTPAFMWQRYRDADLIVAGEVREWENTHFAADLYTIGEKRGLVTVGRVVSEDPGMRACATWLTTVVQEVPAQWLPVGDLYWRAI